MMKRYSLWLSITALIVAVLALLTSLAVDRCIPHDPTSKMCAVLKWLLI